MIFSRSTYAEARVQFASFYHLVDALLLTNTLLILGCGLSDPDFQLLLENFNYRFPNAAPHYMTYAERSTDEFDELVRETRKLKFLKYSPAHNHQELTTSLKAFASAVEEEREQIGASLNW